MSKSLHLPISPTKSACGYTTEKRSMDFTYELTHVSCNRCKDTIGKMRAADIVLMLKRPWGDRMSSVLEMVRHLAPLAIRRSREDIRGYDSMMKSALMSIGELEGLL